jgi:predicted lipid-binding transport protein (Tim44 family)
MSEQPAEEKATPDAQKPPQAASSSLASTIGVGGILSGLLGLLGAAAGAGWPGVIALAGLGLSVPIIGVVLVKYFNAWSDKRDLERAGADAGKTAVDLANQGHAVSAGLDSAQKADPPTEGFKKP